MRLWNIEESARSGNGRAREVECEALVDSGTLHTALPAEIVEALGLRETRRIRATTVDGTRHEHPMVGVVGIEVQGREWGGEVVVLPPGTTPLLGAITLESMDWHISTAERKLLPNPESPDLPQVLLMCATSRGDGI